MSGEGHRKITFLPGLKKNFNNCTFDWVTLSPPLENQRVSFPEMQLYCRDDVIPF